MAARDYLWESMYEGPGYFNFKVNPPMGMFPHTVEGSLVDIGDDQYVHPLFYTFIYPLYTLYTPALPYLHLCTPATHVYTPYTEHTSLNTL